MKLPHVFGKEGFTEDDAIEKSVRREPAIAHIGGLYVEAWSFGGIDAQLHVWPVIAGGHYRGVGPAGCQPCVVRLLELT